MKIRFRHLLIASTALVFASCSKKNEQGKMIPASAAIVVHIDGKSLSAKLPWAEVKDNAAFQEIYKDTALTATVKKILDNPETSGIDIQNDMMFFVQKDSLGGYVGFEGTVKDDAAFKQFIASITENGSASEADGVSYVSKFPVCAGWNKEKFVFVFDAPKIGQMDELSRRMQADSIDIAPSRPRDIGATCKSIFALKESNSLAVNEKFGDMFKTAGDMHFWMNSEELNKTSGSMGAMSMVNLDKLIKGSITSGALNFENGKINLEMMSYGGDELTSLYKKYAGGKLNEDMLKRMPGKDMIGMLAMNFKPEGIREFLKLLNLDGAFNLLQSKIGFNLDDFVKANKGDIALGFSDLTMVTDTATSPIGEDELSLPAAPKPSFKVVFAAAIGDKDAFNKLVNAGKTMGGALAAQSEFPLAFASNGTYFALGNSQQNVDQYIAGANSSSSAMIDQISGHPFGGYMSLQGLMKAFGGAMTTAKDSTAMQVYNASLKLWDNVLWKGGDFTNGGVAQQFEVNLIDKNTNSLKQLNGYAKQLGELMKQQRQKREMNMRAFEDAALPGSVIDTVMPPTGTK